MLLRYTNEEGRQFEVELGTSQIVIGRDAAADIMISGEKVSRMHCAIRCWDGDYVIKDMKSRNGTYINDARVEAAVIKFGDVIRVGQTDFVVARKSAKGTTTVLREIGHEMEEGNKGYTTILREIVSDAEDSREKQGKPDAVATE